jgi:hydrogenase maturation protease
MTATLFVGLGSPHGDDQVGWLVAERLDAGPPPGWAVRRATVPLDLFDWLGGIGRLVLCDACTGGGRPGQLHRWRWPDATIAGLLRPLGSHDFGLQDVLRLADTLGELPPETVLWGIEIGPEGELCDPSPWLDAVATAAADAIRADTESRSEPGAS